jgi:outer membrane protein assembly factor BamB
VGGCVVANFGPPRFVDVYTTSRPWVKRFASRGVLNSRWGITIVAVDFGQFSGDLLIGNFGGGRIHAFDPNTGEVLGIHVG